MDITTLIIICAFANAAVCSLGTQIAANWDIWRIQHKINQAKKKIQHILDKEEEDNDE